MSIGAICLALAACGSSPTGLITEDRVDLVEVDRRNAEVLRQEVDQLVVFDVAELDEVSAQPSSLVALRDQSLLEVFVGDQSTANQ